MTGAEKQPLLPRAIDVSCYAFAELLRDIGGWLLLGVLIAALVAVLVPDGFFAILFKDQAASLVLVLLVGIPQYIYASASTPIVAALVLKGLSQGSDAHSVSVWGHLTALLLLALIGRAFWVFRKAAGCCSD